MYYKNVKEGFKLDSTLPMCSGYTCATHPAKGSLVIPSHVTQYFISICEVETAKSDICSISYILFSWTKKMFEETRTIL